MYNTKNRYEQGQTLRKEIYIYRQLCQTGWICTVDSEQTTLALTERILQ